MNLLKAEVGIPYIAYSYILIQHGSDIPHKFKIWIVCQDPRSSNSSFDIRVLFGHSLFVAFVRVFCSLTQMDSEYLIRVWWLLSWVWQRVNNYEFIGTLWSLWCVYIPVCIRVCPRTTHTCLQSPVRTPLITQLKFQIIWIFLHT